MPLIDDLLGPQRVASPREDAQKKRASGSDLSALLDRLKERGTNTAKGAVSSAISSLPSVNDLLGTGDGKTGVTQIVAPSIAAGSATGSGAAPTLKAGGAPSAIIGTGPYQVGKGAPALRSLAQQVASTMGWDAAQFQAWDAIINAESSWNPNAQNPTSTAFGLGQFLNSTWKGYGPKTSDPGTQLKYMALYIKGRYGDPVKALQEHKRKHWY